VLDKVDEAIAKTESVIAKLRQVRAGLLHDLLTRGLDQHGQLRDPVAHPEQFQASPLGRIPKEWSYGPLASLALVNPATAFQCLGLNDSVSFIPMQDVDEQGRWHNRQERELNEVSSGYTRFQEGDILFAKITPCMENGKGCHALGLTNRVGVGSTEFHVLRPKDGAHARFIFHWTLYARLRRRAEAYMTGSAGQQRVEAKFFDRFTIPFPTTIEEQGHIAALVDEADTNIERHQTESAKLTMLKSGLMTDLLTGRVRVPAGRGN